MQYQDDVLKMKKYINNKQRRPLATLLLKLTYCLPAVFCVLYFRTTSAYRLVQITKNECPPLLTTPRGESEDMWIQEERERDHFRGTG